jgi:rubrerythrin
MSDLISRDETLKAISELIPHKIFDDSTKGYINGTTNAYEIVRVMPPAEPKTGKFIGTEYDGYADGNPVYYEWKCSECGCIFEDDEPTYRYCPNCGAKMEANHDSD